MSARAVVAGRGRGAPRLQVIDGGAREYARRIEVLSEFVLAGALACGPSTYAARLDALEGGDRRRFEWPEEPDPDDDEQTDDDLTEDDEERSAP